MSATWNSTRPSSPSIMHSSDKLTWLCWLHQLPIGKDLKFTQTIMNQHLSSIFVRFLEAMGRLSHDVGYHATGYFPTLRKSRKRRVRCWKNPDINNLWRSQQQLYRVLEDQAWSGLQSNLLDYVSIPRYWWNCWVLQESSSAVAKKSLLGHRDVLTAPPLLLQFHVEWMLLPSQDTQGQKAWNGPTISHSLYN